MDWTPEKMIDAMRRCANPTSRCMVKDCPAAALVEHRCQDLMIAWGAEQIERDQKELAELREKIPQWISARIGCRQIVWTNTLSHFAAMPARS